MSNKGSESKAIVIYSVGVARHLIKNGFFVIDIKPSKYDNNRTAFVFHNTAPLVEEIGKFYKSKKQNKVG